MLVLSRKVGEKIELGNGVVVTVVAIKGSQAKIGIEAPRDMPVHRSEVVEKIRKELQA